MLTGVTLLSAQLYRPPSTDGFAGGIQDFHDLHVELARKRILHRLVVAYAIKEIRYGIARLVRDRTERNGLTFGRSCVF